MRQLVNMIYDNDKSFITSFIGRDEHPLWLSEESLEWQTKYLFFHNSVWKINYYGLAKVLRGRDGFHF